MLIKVFSSSILIAMNHPYILRFILHIPLAIGTTRINISSSIPYTWQMIKCLESISFQRLVVMPNSSISYPYHIFETLKEVLNRPMDGLSLHHLRNPGYNPVYPMSIIRVDIQKKRLRHQHGQRPLHIFDLGSA
jgi:hypothetical protein